MSLVDDFGRLFQGREDAHGLDSGGCARTPPDFDAHLNGEAIGVYPIVRHEDSLDVRWGCVDLDIKRDGKRSYDYETEDEAHDHALTLQLALCHMHITAWIERTRSHGRHVWVFANEWVPAKHMRRCLLYACDVARTSSREVNPKSESLPDGAVGNYVRLPYGDGDITQVMLADKDNGGYVIPCDLFVEEALLMRSSPATFAKWAKLWKSQHPKRKVYKSPQMSGDIPSAVVQMLEEGPYEGSDRSSFLFRLAAACKRGGMPPASTFAVLNVADRHVGKFVDRRDHDRRLNDIIERIYQ